MKLIINNNKARYNVAFQQQESRSIDVELFISVRECKKVG